MRFATALAALALLTGCGSSDDPAAPDAPGADLPDAVVADAPPAAPDPGMAPGTDDPEPAADPVAEAEPVYDEMAYRIVGAQSGDVACYLDLEPESGGDAETYLADFDVCYRVEDEGLTGRLAVYTMETASVMAASCEGDPECPDTDEVELVTAIEILD